MSASYTSTANVEKAIISLLSKGSNPSVEAIRSEIALMHGFEEGEKKGSPNEVLREKRIWQSKVKDILDIPIPKHIPEKVLANFESVWDANQEIAAEAFAKEKNKSEETFLKMTNDLAERDAEITLLKTEQDRSVFEAKTMQKDFDSLNVNLTEKNEQIEGLVNDKVLLADQLSAAKNHLDDERERLSLAQENYINLMNSYGDISAKYSTLVENVLSKDLGATPEN